MNGISSRSDGMNKWEVVRASAYAAGCVAQWYGMTAYVIPTMMAPQALPRPEQ
jgi:hypothetical protein